MRILVSGSTGLIGSALVQRLASDGHSVICLRRGPAASPDEISWNPPLEGPPSHALEGVDAVVHLAGENIASGRWTAAKKRAIRESRERGTALLSQSVSRMTTPPKVFISASAIGFYGDRGSQLLTEESPPGTGFLSEVCRAWEAATGPLKVRGIRVVHLRTGLVLSRQGGALAKMLFPFSLGLGGNLGNGSQYMSWITRDELISIILYSMQAEALRGPVNAVAPNPVTNAEFTKTLGRVLQRPTVLPMPAFAARLVFGEMADALLLSSTRVRPQALERSGYVFQSPILEAALRKELGR